MEPRRQDPDESDVDGLTEDAALLLAAELSQRARQESARARHLTVLLATQPPASAVPSPPEQLTVGCRTCSVSISPTLDDPDEAARQATSFFARHGDCLTFLDLDPIRRVLG